jgi:hypothetical protein
MRRIVGALIVMAIVIAAVLFARRETGAERPEKIAEMVSKQLATAPKGSLTPEAVLAIAPRSTGTTPRADFQLSPSVRELYEGKNYAATYARLSKGPRTPEENWILAKILEYCAMIPGEAPRGQAKPLKDVVAERRARFAASLSASDADREKRLAAFDNVMRNPCEDLQQLKSTREEIEALYKQGAEAGDMKSRMVLLRSDLSAQRRDAGMSPSGSPNLARIGDEQVAVIRQALASSDPTAAMEAAYALAGSFQNASWRDPDGRTIDIAALRNAAMLVACDSGYPCGSDSGEVAAVCAYSGRCDARNLRDYLLYYRSSPYDSQVLARYESALRNAERTGDTSFFVVYPGPSPGYP